MIRSDLVTAIASRFPQLTLIDVDQVVKVILERMFKALVQGDRIEIRGFGSFVPNYRPPRQGRNPKTGKPVSIPAKYAPHFKSGQELRERVERAVGQMALDTHIDI